MGEASEDMSMTAQARKRRMERRAKNNKTYVEDTPSASPNKKIRLGEDVASASEASFSEPKPSTTLSKDALAKIPGIKKQARYVPAATVNMTKEELTLWRKEARRVRNRESAAASRQKTQKRISELEEEVGCITNKYEAALKRIVELEAQVAAGNNSDAWKPKTNAPQHYSSPVMRPAAHPVSPPLSPRNSFSLDEDYSMPELKTTAYYPHSHANTKISRHNAAKILGNSEVDTYAAPLSPDMATLTPQWNDSAMEHAAALVQAANLHLPDEDAANYATNDYPVAMDDVELGDFLVDAMEAMGEHHLVAGTVPVAPMDEMAACDALHILGDLPHPVMNLPPP